MPFWMNPRSLWSSATTTATTGDVWFNATSTTTSSPTIWWSDVSIWDQGTTSATTGTYYIPRNAASLADQHAAAYMNAQMAQQRAANRTAAYERYAFQVARQWDHIFTPSRPAIITHQEQMARDRALYERAMAEHNEQEANRLLREIERIEHLAAEERRFIEERAQRHREQEQQRQAAKARARELLLEHLTPAQRETFDYNGWFIVEGGKSKTRYRIRAHESMVANVDVLTVANRVAHRLCAHVPVGLVPLGDQLLAQKIMLELAEDDFLKKANRHAA